MNMKYLCGGGLVAIALTAFATSPSFAQDNPSASEAEAEEVNGEILVTARRRDERLTDVPISVSVVGGDTLESKGIVRVDDLVRAVPSLQARPTAGRRTNSQYMIRGISSTESLVTGDPAVGIYVNEVYRARATGTNQSFYDIESVQVLYGPQGTLFGRNATGGAVLISTNKPVDRFEGSISGTYGNLNRFDITGMLNIPVAETLQVRVAGQRQKRDGYGLNVTTGRKIANINSYSGRASVQWTPTSGFENITIASLYRSDEKGSLVKLNGLRPCAQATQFERLAATCATSASALGVASPNLGTALVNFSNNVNPLLRNYQTALDGSFRDFRGQEALTAAGLNAAGVPIFTVLPGTTSVDPIEIVRNFNVSNTTTIELSDKITLKNIVGYNHLRSINANDLDGTPFKIVDTYYDTKNRQFTEELQLQGDFGPLQLTIGGLYFRERGTDLQNSVQNVLGDTRTLLFGVNKSYAGFAQGTFQLSPQLSATAGARLTRDERSVQYITPVSRGATGYACTLLATVDLLDGTRDCIGSLNTHFTKPTYTLSLDYKPSRDVLFYVAHRAGYRSGGYQARVQAPIPAPLTFEFRPETVKDAELGFKGAFDLGGDARLRTSIALWKAWYSDLQRQITVPTGLPAPVTTTAIANVGKANVKGFEAELGLSFGSMFEINAFWGYIDGQYDNFTVPAPNPAVITNPLTGIAFTPPLPATPVYPGTTKAPFAAPKNTMGASFAFTPVDDDDVGRISWLTSISYQSSQYGEQSLPFLEPEALAKSQTQINSSIDWKNIQGSGFSAQLWVRNLTNITPILGFTALTGSLGLTPNTIGEPRTYGFTLGYDF